MKKIVTYSVIGFLFLLLVAVRAFEGMLFYDPFLEFFKNDYLLAKIPDYDGMKLFWSHLFRYTVNTLLSLAILYVAFKDRQIVVLSSILYGFVFVILIVAYFYLIKHDLKEDYLLTFYVRRFLIQPILLLVLLPAFYYQKKQQSK